LGWEQPAECPWLEDGYCDESTFCELDTTDCNPSPGS
jgi:hypothetical protein